MRPCGERTIRVRRAKLVAPIRKAVAEGVPLAYLRSLAHLLEPETARRILDAYWRENGDQPGVYSIDLAQLFVGWPRASSDSRRTAR